MTYEFTAKSVPGGIVFLGREKERHDRLMSQFKGGKDVKVVYKPARRTRTPDQNSLYWKRNHELSVETGYSKECLHECFMQQAGYGKTIRTRTAALFFATHRPSWTQSNFPGSWSCKTIWRRS